MIRLAHALEAVFLVVASFYVIDGASKLLTYPSDFTFIAGLFLMALFVWFWVEVILHRVRRFFKDRKKDEK